MVNREFPARKLFAIFCSALIVLVCVACSGSSSGSNSGSRGNSSGMSKDKGGPVTYAALGDSTGVGVGARNGGYVAHLFKRIESERPGSRLINTCVSGATTSDVLRGQVERAVQTHPTLLTLGIGINDISHGVSLETFARNYEEIIKRLKRTEAAIVVTNIPDVSLAPVVPVVMRGNVNSRILSFNERIADVASRHGVTVVDAYSATHEAILNNPEFFSSDGFHPSDLGYEKWAEMMWPSIKSAISE